MRIKGRLFLGAAVMVLWSAIGAELWAQQMGTAFTFQGQLKFNGQSVNETCDFRFTLWDAVTGGNPIGPTVELSGSSAITLFDGLFTTVLDFEPGALTGDDRWLKIEVCCTGCPNNYSTLGPRQKITPVPYSLFSDATVSGGGSGFWADNGNNISNINNGNVGIGLTKPTSPLHVAGNANNDAIFSAGTLRASKDFSETGPGVMVLRALAPLQGHFWTTIDGNDIDGYGTPNLQLNGLDLNANSDGDVRIALGGGNVGIGTTSPQGPLHVQEGSAGDVTAHQSSSAVFERSSHNFVSILSPDDTQRGILFGDPEHAFNGGIVYNSLTTPDGLEFRTGGNVTRMVINENGNVGIGTTTPFTKLEVHGDGAGNAIWGITSNPSGYGGVFSGSGSYGQGQALFVWGDTTMAGSLGIGTTSGTPVPTGVKLAVNGKVLCEEVEVQLSQDWPDFVFEDGYDLMPLNEVAASVRKNKHLPGMPSAQEVEQDGIALGEMQGKLLQKVEELTLHLIALNKELKTLQSDNKTLVGRVQLLESGGR